MGHLREAGMGYFQHMCHALKIGTLMIFAGVCCVIHSVFPFLFTGMASRTIKYIQDKFIHRQIRRDFK